MTESHEDALKRMRMRAWRRGTKEMDLILGPFADARLVEMTSGELALFDELLGENDHDLYGWMTGAATPPGRFSGMVAVISGFAHGRLRAT